MKILLVDDHTLCREGLRYVLSQLTDEVQIFEAGTFGAALVQARSHKDIDLCLLDLALPDTEGFEALTTLHDRFPDIPIVALSDSEEPGDVEYALGAGALGFIPKSLSSELMLNALRLVMSGGIYVPPQLLERNDTSSGARARLSNSNQPAQVPHSTPQQHGLTERQLEVLALVVQGKSNKQIADALILTEGTVKIHVAAICKTLSAANRTQAAITAVHMNLINHAG
ncbi:MAG: response regulator [Acidiferrobacterales bacterium]